MTRTSLPSPDFAFSNTPIPEMGRACGEGIWFNKQRMKYAARGGLAIQISHRGEALADRTKKLQILAGYLIPEHRT
jgi:hypothetical protein